MSAKPIHNIDLKQLLNKSQLPALPQSAIRLLELSKDPEIGPSEFALPIESDPGLTGQVLKFVNSSYFGFSREISNVKLAVNLVGMRTIKNFALWSAVFSLMPNPQCGPFDLKTLWQDSLRRALFARKIASHIKEDISEEVFSAALLQDMAIPLLAKEAPKVYATLLAARVERKARLSAMERKIFGWTHCQAAAMMCSMWNLPQIFSEILTEHEAIDKWSGSIEENPGSFAVALSALLPSNIDNDWDECDHFMTVYEDAKNFGLPPIEEILETIDEEFEDFAPVLKIAVPAKTLCAFFNSQISSEKIEEPAETTAADPCASEAEV